MASHHDTMTPEDRAQRPSWQLEASDREGNVPRFFGLPDRWYEKPRWRCINGHVSGVHLRCDDGGPAARCLAADCGEPVWLTFPEDVETLETHEQPHTD